MSEGAGACNAPPQLTLPPPPPFATACFLNRDAL